MKEKSSKNYSQDEYLPYIRLMVKGSFSLGKTLLGNLGTFKKMRKETFNEKEYIRPPRRYELPPYDESIEHCRENKKYLRPTRYCDSSAPEVIAMAHELGSFEKTDREFAEAAFDFTKRKLTLEILPMDDVSSTLKRGTGTCLHKISVFLSLCRAACIKSRYKLYVPKMVESWKDTFLVDPFLREWYNSTDYFMLHGEGEVYIDGKWEVADVGPTPERQVAGEIPITKFGEDSIGTWLFAEPDSIMHFESLPYGIDILSKVAQKIAPSTIERVNYNILQEIQKGGELLRKIGGEEAYNQQLQKKRKKIVKVELKKKENLIFKK